MYCLENGVIGRDERVGEKAINGLQIDFWNSSQSFHNNHWIGSKVESAIKPGEI
jgi:hypothetical protein